MGESDEFERILSQRAGALRLYAKSLGAQDAEEPVQEAFVRLWSLMSAGRTPENLAAWLFRVVRNGVISGFRSEKRRQRFLAERAKSVHASVRRPDAGWFEPPDNVCGDVCDKELERLTFALESLDSREREIIVARIWGNLTFSEIAELLQLKRSSAYANYRNALAHLKQRLEQSETS